MRLSARCLLRSARAGIALATIGGLLAPGVGGMPARASDDEREAGGGTATPIRHLVVIFQENVSFDHYFGTYPVAANLPGEPAFVAKDDTPAVNGLGTLLNGQPVGVLLTDNPNAKNPANATNAINPFRLDRSQASTCDQDHTYGHEQLAFDQGLMDFFPGSVGVGGSAFCNSTFAWGKGKGLVLGYFDATPSPGCGATPRTSR